ncbi:hypothetical protein D4R42_04165 [bacterium]|nr:MAG: hypothetical protein D4R42_04165 [bacterium]
MKYSREEVIRKFVRENYSEETRKKMTELSDPQKEMVEYFLKKSIGPNKKGLIAIFKDNEGCIVIDRNGHVFGPS